MKYQKQNSTLYENKDENLVLFSRANVTSAKYQYHYEKSEIRQNGFVALYKHGISIKLRTFSN